VIVELDEVLARRAGTLAETRSLRGFDASPVDRPVISKSETPITRSSVDAQWWVTS
jgi:hypothetical protein